MTHPDTQASAHVSYFFEYEPHASNFLWPEVERPAINCQVMYPYAAQVLRFVFPEVRNAPGSALDGNSGIS
jgi:hypothetical protein